MNRIVVFSAAGMLAWTIAAYTQVDVGVRTFHGEISDSQCALNVHSLTRSHKEMLKSKYMGGNARSCSQYCIEHMGGELVLAAGKTVFRLDNQNAVREFAGQKAKIMGTLDAKTKTIHVVKVEIEAH
jgi:hypothetical protein